MIVVAVLMISCQVLMLCRKTMDGAHTITSATQKAKNTARLTIFEDAVANRSNQPSFSPVSSSGISSLFCELGFFRAAAFFGVWEFFCTCAMYES